jgi:hypothetical protein
VDFREKAVIKNKNSPWQKVKNNEKPLSHKCPLCTDQKVHHYHTDRFRTYIQCSNCSLVFVPQEFHLSIDQEKIEYDKHENSLKDAGYLRFLSRFSVPFLEKLGHGENGLDYGCGPAPALAQQLESAGHTVARYDPLYWDDKNALQGTYDFICTTEVAEHFRKPQQEFDLLFGLLKGGGWLGIMTKMVLDQSVFASWHYIRDMTHVAFYSRETFVYIGRTFGANVTFIKDDVIIMQKIDREDNETLLRGKG